MLPVECNLLCNALCSSVDTLRVLDDDGGDLSAEVFRVGGGGFGRLAVLLALGLFLTGGLGLLTAVFLLGAGFGGPKHSFSAFSSAVKLARIFSVDFLRNFLGAPGLEASSLWFEKVFLIAGFGRLALWRGTGGEWVRVILLGWLRSRSESVLEDRSSELRVTVMLTLLSDLVALRGAGGFGLLTLLATGVEDGN